MLKRIETDQHGQFVRIPEDYAPKSGTVLDVSQRADGAIVLKPVDEEVVVNAVRLAELFEDWEGIYQPSDDEWQADEGED
ncbi:hypothetical protein WVI01_02500 [Weissella viridescens]|jgi:hypothetical protein|uniref:Uncharacterized protein n=1 Tax=Weissella viridescens TaxID=1629 RepID=A0A0R2H5U9_WEIVI|nr:hypothetical protein [Weissella viridescens]KRN46982.1 hypothetical protein IV50_GL000249 [Weissella viridescens]QOD85524.1 hypothetical protein IE337_04790 [Weissella viridescens]WJI90632.1 hypothetical protein PWA48_04780 [Weissella viridescens]GEA94327.1 hypothetical protein WVI01_02500 [Weissella viridescens]